MIDETPPLEGLCEFEDYLDSRQDLLNRLNEPYGLDSLEIEKMSQVDQLEYKASLMGVDIIRTALSALNNGVEAIKSEDPFGRTLQYNCNYNSTDYSYALRKSNQLLEKMRDHDFLGQYFEKHGITKDTLEIQMVDREDGTFGHLQDYLVMAFMLDQVSDMVALAAKYKYRIVGEDRIGDKESTIENYFQDDLTGVDYLRNRYREIMRDRYEELLSHPREIEVVPDYGDDSVIQRRGNKLFNREALGYPALILAIDFYEDIVNDCLDPDLARGNVTPEEKNILQKIRDRLFSRR